MTKSRTNESLDISLRCALALAASTLAMVFAVGMFVFALVQPETQNNVETAAVQPPLHTVASLVSASPPIQTEVIRFTGKPSSRIGDLNFNGYGAFVIESESRTGPLGVVIADNDADLNDLRGTLNSAANVSSRAITVRLRPDLSRRASIELRPFAPGRPVVVLEAAEFDSPPPPTNRNLTGAFIFAAIGIACAVLFAVFRREEVRNSALRNKHLGEDQPWRTNRLPSSWAKENSRVERKK